MHLKITPKTLILSGILFLSLLLNSGNVQAQTIYVTDHFKITMRTGPDNTKRIIRMLPSNTPLQVIKEEQGWLKVRTREGKEGWVLKRFTMQDKPKKIIIKQLRSKNEDLEQKIAELSSRAASLEEANATLNSLTSKYEKLKKDAGSVLTLKKKFQNTKQKLENATQKLEEISKENKKLRASTSREWFLAGAGVVGLSALLGFIIGRIQKRRSRKLYL